MLLQKLICKLRRFRPGDSKTANISNSDTEPLGLKEIKEEIEDLKDKISNLHNDTNQQITEYENIKELRAVDKASQINLFELSPDTRSLTSPGEQQEETTKVKPSSVYSSDEETDSVTVNLNPSSSTCERDSGYSDKLTPSDVSSEVSGTDGVKLSRSSPSRCVR